MTEGDLIILDNNERYSLLKKIPLNGDIYFMAAFVKDDDLVDKSRIVYFRSEDDGKEQYVDLVTSEKIIAELTNRLVDEVQKDAK